MAHKKLLAYIQTEIESLYELPRVADVNDYLITDKLTAKLLHGDSEQRDLDEKLLMCVTNDVLEVALYLDAAVLESLNVNNPLLALSNNNLQDFLTLVEGVSHFVYVAHKGVSDKPLSLFELELQGEIDKFVIVLRLLQKQGYVKQFAPVFKQLFVKVQFSDGLTEQEYYRYRLVNQLAAIYCQRLQTTMNGCGGFSGVSGFGESMAELKRFYRYGHANKTRIIKKVA